MFKKLTGLIGDKKKRNVTLLAGGMAGIALGGKAGPLGLFVSGAYGLEKVWREEHPEFDGGIADRWQEAIRFYDETHQNSTNRTLHTVGIPMILGGALGLLAAPRFSLPWFVANGSYTTGWILNFIGHGVYEKGAPAFADDPLSFIAGPVWDYVRIKDRLVGKDAPSQNTPSVQVKETVNAPGAMA